MEVMGMGMFPFKAQTLLHNHHNILFSTDLPDIYYPMEELHTEKRYGRFLQAYQQAIASPNQAVTGSMFVKRYSVLLAGALYTFMHYDYGIDLSLHNVNLILDKQELLYFLLKIDEPVSVALASSRLDKRAKYIRHMLMENVTPIFEHIIRYTQIDALTLWSTLSYLLAYWKEVWLRDAELPELRERIELDYRYLLKEAKLEWFGQMSQNPLREEFRSIADPIHLGEKILLRFKCCLSYCLSEENRYCYTCPRITDQQRIAQYIAAHA